jgi:hypothetical protein
MVDPLTLPLRRAYSDRTLLVSGLSADGEHERYLFIDLTTGRLTEIRIGITDLRARQLATLREHLGDAPIPYGLDRVEDLLPYFLHPHSFVQSASGEVIVSFKQSPYMRILGTDETDSPLWPPASEIDFTQMISSTACELKPGTIGYGVTRSADRLARYVDGVHPLRSSVWQLDLATRTGAEIGPMPDFALDTMHELNASPLGFLIGVDMNLTVEPGTDGVIAGADGAALDVEAYARNPFPVGRFVVTDPRTSEAIVQETTASCSAHVDVDLDDPEVFYVSCNNISKWRTQVVVHGAGVVERYRYRDGSVVLEGAYSAPDFQRITSQHLFRYEGRQLMVVTGYPNRLFVLDPSDMSLVRSIELFDDEITPPPYACAKNSLAPLYLAVEPEGRHVFMTGASTLFVVDLVAGAVVDRVEFCAPGSLAATAHIGLINRMPASV